MLKIVLPEKAEAVLNFRPDPELLARIENNWLTNQQKGSSRKRKGPSTKVTCARTNSWLSCGDMRENWWDLNRRR